MHHLGPILLATAGVLACSPKDPSLVEATTPIGADAAPSPAWVAQQCLAQTTEQALTLGLLFEAAPGLMLDVDNGGKIVTWPTSTSPAPSGLIALDSGQAAGNHVEGSQALCAHVSGKAGWRIDARLAHTDDANSRLPVDLGDFVGGYLEFELKTDGATAVTVEWLYQGTPRTGTVAASEYAQPSRFGGDWKTVRIPLCSFQSPDLSSVLSPIGLYPLFQTATMSTLFCADAIRWVRPGSCPSTCK